MASGYTQEWSKTGRFTGKFRFYYSTSFNASTNRSTVTIRPQFWCSANYGNDYRIFSYGVSGAGVYVNGSCVYAFGSNYGSGNYLSCGSATESWANLDYSTSFEVAHDGNGDASFTVGIYGSVRAMYDGTTVSPIGGTASDRIYLHENAASSIASASSSVATQGTFSLTMKRLASTNYHIATVRYGSSAALYTSGRFDTSLSFTVPRSWFANYPDLAALPLTVSVQTYNSSGTAIGSPATKALTVNADADMRPVIAPGWVSLAPYNTGAVAGITGYVKGYSRAEATFDSSRIDMTAAVGASIASFSVTCQGETDSSAPYLTSVLSSTSVPVVCTVTDTRGMTASESFPLTVMDYAKPVLTGIAIFRCDAQGEAAEDGTHYSAKAVLTYSPLGGQNLPALSSAVAASGGAYGAEEVLTSGAARISTAQISADITYRVRITATDTLGNTAVYYQVLPTRKWAMKFRPTGNGVAFGKAAEHDNTFEIAEDWDFRVHGKEINTLLREKLLSLVYPVGSIYMSVSSVSPAAFLGGTWEQLQDRFLLGAGSAYAAGSSGGAATHHHSTANHTLTVNEIPAHNHTVTVKGGYGGVKSDGTTIQKGYEATFGTLRSDSATTANKGGNAAHSHGNTGTASSLPPYLAVYMWKRTG